MSLRSGRELREFFKLITLAGTDLPGTVCTGRPPRYEYVFLNSGHLGGLAGVVRMTRTLETPKLAKMLEPWDIQQQLETPG